MKSSPAKYIFILLLTVALEAGAEEGEGGKEGGDRGPFNVKAFKATLPSIRPCVQ